MLTEEKLTVVSPKRRSLYRYAVDTFIEMLSKVQYRSKAYQCNDNDVISWNLFLESFSHTNIDKDFIRKFCEYGMHSWFNKDVSEHNKQYCRFSWIFGRNSVERWRLLNADAKAMYIRTELKKNYDGIGDVKIKPQLKNAYINLRPVEEKFKKEYLNTGRGFAWCIVNTTLYNHLSSNCASCKFKNECKEVLKENYSKIYKLRGYDKR